MKKLITLLSVVCLLFVGTANSHGSILVNAVESNGDVVFSGGGTVDTSGLSYFATNPVVAALWPILQISRWWPEPATNTPEYPALPALDPGVFFFLPVLLATSFI